MNVLLINGSPHERGCTDTALREVAGELERAGVRTRIFWIGRGPVRGCIGCGGCAGKGRCVFDDDPVNEALALAQDADGFQSQQFRVAGANAHAVERSFFHSAFSFVTKLDPLDYTAALKKWKGAVCKLFAG